jgi:hypothetical protein
MLVHLVPLMASGLLEEPGLGIIIERRDWDC